MRDADMSVSTGQIVGDVRPRFISLHEGLRLTRSSSSPPSDRPSSSEGTTGEHRPRCEREDRSTRDRRAELPPYLLERCTGIAGTGLRVFDGRGRQYLPGRGGDGEAVETSQVGVGDQPGLPVALLELDRWKSPRLADG